MTNHEIYAAAWRKMAEIISDVDMDDYEDDDKIIEAMDKLIDGFEDQALGLESEQLMLANARANLVVP